MMGWLVFHFSPKLYSGEETPREKAIVSYPSIIGLCYSFYRFSQIRCYSFPFQYTLHRQRSIPSSSQRFNISLIKELHVVPFLNKYIFKNFEVQYIWGVSGNWSAMLILSNKKATRIMKSNQVFTYFWSELTDLNRNSFLN